MVCWPKLVEYKVGYDLLSCDIGNKFAKHSINEYKKYVPSISIAMVSN